jgi:hypothetical protein
MSYCAGWKHKGSVYLLADTVSSVQIPPRRQQISLGELLTEHHDEPIEEPALKLVRIAPGAVAACTGDAGSVSRLLEFLQANHAGVTNNGELLSLLDVSLGPFSDAKPVSLLLASSGSDGACELLRWTSPGGLDTTGSDLLQIGDPTPFHTALSPEILSILAAADPSPERMLPVLTAIVQSRGVSENSSDLNVNGLIFGVRTGLGVATWQEDTLVVLYDQAFASPAHVAVLARSDELVVHASHDAATRVFVPLPSNHRRAPREACWLRGIQDELAADRFRFRVFISTCEQVITLIIRNDFERESGYVRLKRKSNGQFDFSLSPEMTSLLLRPLEDRSQGSVPLRLSLRED